MCKAQRRLQHPQQRAARAALLLRRAVLQLHLGELQVPIAVFVPDEAVDRAGEVVEAVFLEALGHFSLGVLQLAHDPAVGKRKFHGRGVVRAAVLALGVHQHEARGVPQLVAEVAVALAAVQVEVERAREAGE